MRDRTVRALSAVHTLVFKATRGLIGRRLVGNDMLLLTTTGRVTGKPHTVPLLYLSGADTLVVIAYGGRDHHPEWYLNLVDDPRVVDAYAGYREYQSRTGRQIPMVLLEE